MNKTLSALVLALSVFSASAQDSVQEQLQTLASRVFFSSKTALMGVRVVENKTGKRWELQFWDPNFKDNQRLIVMNGGTLVRDETGLVVPFELAELTSLGASEIETPVSRLREKARARASGAGVKVAEFRYILSHPQKKDPAWRIVAVNDSSDVVGYVQIHANNGKVLSETWGAGAKTAASDDLQPAKKGLIKFGSDVEKTFKGIGGDLEEFFSGKRTVDKE